MEQTAYLRVSSKSQGYDTQKVAIEKLASSRGDTITTWYEEKRSGKSIDRPALKRLLADVGAGKLRGKRLYVFRLDRLTRSGIRDTLEVVDQLRAGDCLPVSVTDGFSLDGPVADVVLAVLAFAAQVELLAKNERISAARDRLEKEGRAWGRPSRISPELRGQIHALRAEGRSFRAIAIAVKVPLATVARACRKVRADYEGAAPGMEGDQQGAF